MRTPVNSSASPANCSEQRLQCFRLKYAADNTLGQGIHPVAAEVQRVAEKIEPQTTAHQICGRILPRIDHADAHGEHEGVGYAEIIPQDHVPEKEREIAFISDAMDTETDHRMAEDHRDDRQRLEKLEIILSRNPEPAILHVSSEQLIKYPSARGAVFPCARYQDIS